jgi:hypothetical protein
MRRYSALFQRHAYHRREQIYPAAGNHNASPGNTGSSKSKPSWRFRKWIDPLGEHPEISAVDPSKPPYPVEGAWDRCSFKAGNIT